MRVPALRDRADAPLARATVALCHYCDYQVAAPTECPECQFAGIRYRGLGTQRLEAEVRARFPGHRCLRMDTDTMQKPGSHERRCRRFAPARCGSCSARR